MSIKKLLVIGFLSFALILSGCFSTDSDDDDVVIPDTLDVQLAIDSLASIGDTAKIDSGMAYTKSGSAYTLTDSTDTISFTASISSNVASLAMDWVNGSDSAVITMNMNKVIGPGTSFDGTVWQLTSVSLKNSDTTVTYTLISSEIQLFYLYNSKTYSVESGISIDEIFNQLFEDAKGYGDVIGTWYVKYYEETTIWNNNADTNVYYDSTTADSVFTIITIATSSLKTYDYDDEEMAIEVEEQLISGITNGGTFDLSSEVSLTVVEENGELSITIIEDYSEWGSYEKEVLTCSKYTGTIPPVYWVVDTTMISDATLLTTDGTLDSGSIDTTDQVDVYKFAATAGKIYHVVTSSESESSDVDIDVYYMDGSLKNIVNDDDDEVMVKAASNMTYFVDVYSHDENIDYTISVKEIDVITTPAAVIDDWYCSAMPVSDTSSLTFTQDSSVFYSTLTADSITVYMMVNGKKESMKDAIYFATGNKCYFFGEEYDYILSGTTMSMYGSDMAFVWTVFTGTSFPPEKYVDFGILQQLFGDGGSRMLR